MNLETAEAVIEGIAIMGAATHGVCDCGCGGITPPAKKTDGRRGLVKGEPIHFLPGHQQKLIHAGDVSQKVGILKARKQVAAQVIQPWTEPGAKEITESDILALREMDDLDVADIYDARVRSLERVQRRSFVEIGLICNEVSERELWRKLVCPPWIDEVGRERTGEYFHSFDAWMFSSLNVARSSAYSAMKLLNDLKVPVADLQQMPRCNALKLASLSTKVQEDPKVIEAAKAMTEEDFIAEVMKIHPNQHLEAKKAVIAQPTKTERDLFDNAIEVAKWVYEVERREDALSNIVAFFMDGLCEHEAFQKYTNRDAYEAYKARMA